jgi:hypothetical protein
LQKSGGLRVAFFIAKEKEGGHEKEISPQVISFGAAFLFLWSWSWQ